MPAGGLIDEFQRKLYLARSLGRQDVVECRRTNIAIRQPEIRAIQNVEQLRTELELLRFGDSEILESGEVPFGIARSEIYVAAFRAELSGICCGIELLKSAGVEPRTNFARSAVGVADEVGPLC